ncbi:hypothetical protein [Thermomonospora echinospora]|uniref:hypothetical protein n=1 Tax=Thermomonospora echinospora TaxID=1992 RepID=UPI0011B05833|nr:hypothetical protein [Thermomonospora echinospora]
MEPLATAMEGPDGRFSVELQAASPTIAAEDFAGVVVVLSAGPDGVRYLAVFDETGGAGFAAVPAGAWTLDVVAGGAAGGGSAAGAVPLPAVRPDPGAVAASTDRYRVMSPAGVLYAVEQPGPESPFVLEVVAPPERAGLLAVRYTAHDGTRRHLLVPVLPSRTGGARARVRLDGFAPHLPWEAAGRMDPAALTENDQAAVAASRRPPWTPPPPARDGGCSPPRTEPQVSARMSRIGAISPHRGEGSPAHPGGHGARRSSRLTARSAHRRARPDGLAVLVALPGARARRSPGEPAAPVVGPCSILLTDVVGFGGPGRTDEDRRVIRAALYRLLREAFEAAGLTWEDCHHEDRGDGVLVVIPPTFPAAASVDPLVPLLAAGLRRHNAQAAPGTRFRLRAALHVGPVTADAEGVCGEAIIRTARMLDAPVLRRRLAGTGACLGFITSAFVYDSVVRHASGLVDPGGYRRVELRVKESALTAWMHLR